LHFLIVKQAHNSTLSKQELHMADKATEMTPRDRQHWSRPEQLETNPFRLLDRFADEMEKRWHGTTFGGRTGLWAPDIEVSRTGNELVVCADLPGMKKDEVSVEVTDSDITISGERRHTEETDQGGLYRTERSYGSFCRTIPLPEGAMADQANATFKNGVLEIRMPAPGWATRGRRLEIKDAAESRK